MNDPASNSPASNGDTVAHPSGPAGSELAGPELADARAAGPTLHREWLAVGLVVAGVTLGSISSLWLSEHASRWGIVTGAVSALAGAALFSRRVSQAEHLLAQREEQLRVGVLDLETDQHAFEELREQVESAMQTQADRLEARSRQLADRLVSLQEWGAFVEELEDTRQRPPIEQERQLEQDRRLLELLEQEAHSLFDAILQNRYATGGRFDARLLREDLYELAERVARVYRPESQQPLLETSPEQILRATSRISLHLMTVVDELPLGVAGANINDLYNYVRSAVKAYGAYKTAEPYLGFLGHGLTIGRAFAATNPAATGAWWVAMQLGKQGGKILARKYLENQAIRLIHELIRIVAYEVATLYSPGFRWRDEHWLFGVELVQLVRHFPVSRDTLQAALTEVERLPLRNEHDRVFLFRSLCGSGGRRLETFDPALLTTECREGVARRLEEFLDRHAHGVTDENFAQWAQAVAERLQVQIMPRGELPARSSRDSAAVLVRSWLTFAVRMKQMTLESAVERVAALPSASALPESLPRQIAAEGMDGMPEQFEPADLDPRDAEVERYVRGLLELTILADPFDAVQLELVRRSAVYYRCEPSEYRQWESDVATSWLAPRLPEKADVSQRDAELALSIRQRDDLSGSLLGCYRKLQIETGSPIEMPPQPWVLVLTSDQLVLFPIGLPERTIWRAVEPTQLHRVGRILSDDCRLIGGQWEWTSAWQGDSLLLSGQLGQTFERHFAALVNHPLTTLVSPDSNSSSSRS